MKIVETFTIENVLGFRFGSKPFGRPRMFSHVYYVDGLLIDTGHRNMSSEVFNHVKHLNVHQQFITHFHEDHTGNLPELQKHFNCPVYASSRCCEIMKDPPPISLAQKVFWGDRPSYDLLQAKADTIATENFSFKIIPIPGHAPDMVALYEPKKGWLFSADLYVNSYIGYFLKEENMLEQMQSIKKVLKLDFDVLFCSHNPQMEAGKDKLAEKLRFLEDFYESVAALHQKGYSATQIFKQLDLKEYWLVRLFSHGHLSKMNMVKSVINSLGSFSPKQHI